MSREGSEEVPAIEAAQEEEFEEEQYVDVKSLPLRPPVAAAPPPQPVRRPWHPVMWDSSIIGIPPPDYSPNADEGTKPGGEYPHKQRLRNLKRLVAEGKVKPTKENLIFFLCNKFAISEERANKISC
ncbi:uncharacterized protein LOC134665196 [Cydia fagiglandana]|uniref:uncharacterized protein LOC134665196 n=1 Tax=Cydia fagiglandana TaxID=1458189 RepID=UPI00213492AB